MIRFFRKIRQNLFTEKRFSKYLLYAIGEIILVVLGILIALGINNWNQRNANEQRIITTLRQVQNDLLNDIQEVVPLEADYQNRISGIRQFLADSHGRSYTKTDIYDMANWSLSFRSLVLSNQSFLNLKDQVADIPTKYDEVMFNLNRLYVENAGFLLEYQNRTKNQLESYESSLLKKHNWMEDYLNFEMTDEIKAYFLTSEEHRRQMVANKVLFQNHQTSLGLIKSHSILCYLVIREVLNDNSEMPGIIKAFKLDYPQSNVEEYIGSYQFKGIVSNTIEMKHGVLFLNFMDSNDVQADGIILQEESKDSLVWLINTRFLIEFERDSVGQIDGFYSKDIDIVDQESVYIKKVRE